MGKVSLHALAVLCKPQKSRPDYASVDSPRTPTTIPLSNSEALTMNHDTSASGSKVAVPQPEDPGEQLPELTERLS
jgi:hypothetical protein